MKTIFKNTKKTYRRKLLATSIAAVCSMIFTTSVSQASDIEIYQQAKTGNITLMMMLDVSTSMNGVDTAQSDLGLSDQQCSGSTKNKSNPLYGYSRTYCTVSQTTFNNLKSSNNVSNKKKAEAVEEACNKQSNGSYHCGDRIARMLDAMYELLNGNVDKGIVAVGDDKIIGLSIFGADTSDNAKSKVLVPARRLGCKAGELDCYNMDGAKTQRQILTEEIIKLTGISYTPTAWGYAEVISYMMGVRPSSRGNGFDLSYVTTKTGDGNSQTYQAPASLTQTDSNKQCSGQGIYVLTDGQPNATSRNTLGNMQIGLDNSNFSCSTNNKWDCQHSGAIELLAGRNKKKLVVKTAVVGFGKEFQDVTSYDRNKTRDENIAALGDINTDPKNAAYWGIIGGGGWYSGSSPKSVVDSVNNFINDLSTTIPSVTTGSPTIPKDALNPAILQDDAYYQQFQPTPDKSYQLWTGNLKKYLVTTGGVLKDKTGTAIVDVDGKIVDNYDYWSELVTTANQNGDENTIGSSKFALRGGTWSKLLLRTNPLDNPSTGTVQRKILTDRIYLSGSGANSVFGASNNELRQVKPVDLVDSNYKNDEYRSYLVRALGYNIDAATPPTSLDDLKTAVEFRQTGAVMHSQPILVTNKGKLEFNESTQTMGSTGREDYVLFGTTQGALHVVKAGTSGIAGGGEEVFTFIPNEMLVKQKQAFEKPEVTSGGTNQLFYGVDGPWTAYTEYVVDGSGYLTVGDGKGDQKGVQNVYGGLRMGGRSYYALDLKDIQNPKLKFHINPDSALAGTPLSYMGQSWSKPTIGFVNWGGKRTRVMFVGGGYDDGYESTSYDQTNKKGAGVYMFSAEDTSIQDGNNTVAIKAGELLWWSSANATTSTASTKSGAVGINSPNMQYSVVSEIRSVDRDGDDLIDHVYFGDLGGQIFRTDFNNNEKTIGSWAKAPVRIFNGHKATGKSPRFYDMPAFSLYSNNGSIFAVVSQGSGNRSTPLFADSSYDYDAIYNIYDKDVARKDLYNYDPVKAPLITKDVMADNVSGLRLINDDMRKENTVYNAPASTHGWYYQFEKCVTGYGKCDSYKQQTEKVFGTPIALNNKLFVSTFDASKDGLAGDCGAGVKGASLMTTFCLPFGQCAAGDVTGTTHTMIGAGIHTVTVGNGNSSGNGGSPGGGTGGGSSKLSSASNYCIATGSRVTITVTGSSGSGEQTRMCLVPQRWYEKL